MSWEKESIEDISITPLRNGIYKGKEFQGSGAKIINMKELFAYDFIGGQEMKRLELNSSEEEKYLVQEGDLIFARRSVVAEGAGKTSIIKNLNEQTTFESSMIRVRLDQNICNPLFYYYYFSSYQGRSQVLSLSTGVNVKGIKGSSLKKLMIPKPDLQTQQKIASILSAYDDLIENNLKRIKLLEEAAQHLYKEWFVNFRFPRSENIPINNETGLPEGWEEGVVKDFATVLTGKTPSTKKPQYFGGEIPFIKTPDMHNSAYVIKATLNLTEEGSNSQIKKLLPKNSVLVTCIGTAGVVALNALPSQFNQQINAVTFDTNFKTYFFYCFAKGLKPLLEGLGSNGTTMVNVNKTKFENIEMEIPSENILNQFHSIVRPFFDQILILLKQNNKLKQARDLLLPRLMNRTIKV